MALAIFELLKNMFKKPVTVNYPFETEGLSLPSRYRGLHVVDQEKCIGCSRCARECPAFVITMVSLTDKELAKRTDKKKRKPVFDLSACIFCGVCEDVCPVDCIDLTNKIPLPAEDTATLVVD